MHLDQLQSLLEAGNGITAPLRVSQALLPPVLAQRLRGDSIRLASEQVFAWQHEAELHVGVYIDPRLQCRLALADPGRRLDEANLPALLAAAEGVSHFVALTWAAERDRPVSALELELQGEIDKFALCCTLAADAGRHDPGLLFERLFERVRFAADLSAEEAERYRTAHRVAARLVRRWLERYGGETRHPDWVAERRRFFHLSREAKLRW